MPPNPNLSFPLFSQKNTLNWPHPHYLSVSCFSLPLNIPPFLLKTSHIQTNPKKNSQGEKIMNITKATTTTTLLLTLLLITELSTLSRAARPGPNPTSPGSTGPDGGDGGLPFFGPGGGFGIPGFDMPWGQGITGGGYGYGYGSPKGGYARSGTIRPTVVCRDKGPCYMKKLTCPAKCFSSFSKSGKGYGAGGGGGGCTMDCKNKCIAYC